MSTRNTKRLEAIEARAKDAKTGVFFLTERTTKSGEIRYVSQSSRKAYTAQEVVALAEAYPEAVIMLPIDRSPDEPLDSLDGVTTEEDIQAVNAYTERLFAITTETGKTRAEVERSITDPELLALKAKADVVYRRWEAHDRRVAAYEARTRPWSDEMKRRLDILNGKVPDEDLE